MRYLGGVRLISVARVLFTFLAFQLALGLQVNVAYTHPSAAPATTASVDDSSDCPMHHASAAGVERASPDSHAGRAKTSHDKLSDKHDCCKSSGCQCQCGNLPFALDMPTVGGVPASILMQQLPTAPAPTSRADAHFRPPIAS